MSQIGARSNMLGGAVVGSVRDNSAIFYNPAGLAFVDNSSFSVMGDAYYLDLISFKNGAGDGIDLKSSSIEANPQLFAGIFKSKKKPWLTVNYAIINRGISRTSLNAKHTGSYDVFEVNDGDEDFYSTTELYNETREDWAGVGYGYKINDQLGLGFSIFATFFSQTHREVIDINIVDGKNINGLANIIGLQQTYNNLRYTNVALLGKFGISYEFDKFRFGGNITLPRVPLALFSSSNTNRNNTYFIPTLTTNSGKVAYTQNKIPNQYKSPLSIDIGCKIKINNKNLLYFTTAYFHAVRKYNILTFQDNLNKIDSLLVPRNSNYTTIAMANKALINVAIGYEYKFKESLTMLYGFRTDFNNIDYDELNDPFAFIPSFSDWDIYHLSGGVEWENEKLNLSLGLNTSYGNSKNQRQFVDLTNPNEENLLLGDLSNNVNATFVRLTLLVGFTFYFQKQQSN